ncbi:MAG TPA: sensor histidine kinase [Candidatus Baltobacteraceae bacterium]|nr:sensor histidine kinase [Candidatus Baltobacteraceae bacterium]
MLNPSTPRAGAWLGLRWQRAAARASGAWPQLLLVPAAIYIGLLVERELVPATTGGIDQFGYQTLQVWVLGNAVVGWSTVAAGLIAWFRRPDEPGGRILTAAGFAWFLGAASWASSDGGAFQGYYILLVSALVLTYPSGRIGSRAGRVILAVIALTLAVSTIGHLAVQQSGFAASCDPSDPTCLPAPVTALSEEIPGANLYNLMDSVFRLVLGLATAGVLAVMLRSFGASSGPNRRVLVPAVAMAAALAAAVVLAVVRRSTGLDESLADTLLAAVIIALALLPQAFTWDLLRGRLARGAVADLVVRLAEPAKHDDLGVALRRALGDPSLAVLTWSPDGRTYLDEAGHPVELPREDVAHAVTRLTSDVGPVGALVHDPALRARPDLLGSVSAAAAMAIDNRRLAAEVQARLEDLQASRARIVAAGVEERQRLERDLHDGAQQQLVALAIALRVARGRVDAAAQPELARSLGDASERAAAAIVELRELARGIHPPALSEAGLSAALDSLAARAPIPVTVEASLPKELPPAVATTAYFIVAEALTNVSKHAEADRAHVHAEVVAGRLRLTIDDDGRGGADLSRGSGLRGLADRAAALGGSLSVTSRQGHGTRLLAEIPCAS